MLILDLDDTLIDTTGSLRERKLGDARDAMQAAGFTLAPSLERLLQIDAECVNTRESLERFVTEGKGEARFVQIGMREYYGVLPSDAAIVPLEGVLEILPKLREFATVVLLTLGFPDRQWEKISRSGLDRSFFDRIVVESGDSKRKAYIALAEEYGAQPGEVVVCGDKVEVDLLPAKELGYTTVRMEWGHARRAERDVEGVDYRVQSLEELWNLVQGLYNSK